ncbi:NAD-dependent dehydratase [Acidihalobacter yilgarnensis]|uniref:NAD-dependent dehydratase n=1 Tax=Acidihalobacter yilgarnensis TaxID=2819280 RepID=A0A1D8IQB6_9GAMM|nr:GDP-mannose 4,6-dehydratase [Acidihalobacter yilgarnensis]AOU98647.1 NAD-dependent dehydratase [Acidihalobacter yilgarnensis]
MHCLLTGSEGFVGGHVRQGIEGCVPFLDDDGVIDLREAHRLEGALTALAPFDAVIHLAAQSFVPASFDDPPETFAVNFQGTYNLLVALRAIGFRGRFLYVGSADTYGRVDETALPVTEDQPLRPRNPYAVSKVAAEALCYQWSQSGPFEVVMARPFNHIGPGQSPRFAVSDFARQIAMIALDRSAPVLNVGDIDVTRDFTDVRDVVRAYELLLARGRNGEVYNVCSGRELDLRGIITRLAAMAGVSVRIEQDAARLRPSEQRRMVGSHAHLSVDTGWAPALMPDESLRAILDDWMERLTGE